MSLFFLVFFGKFEFLFRNLEFRQRVLFVKLNLKLIRFFFRLG